MTPIECLVVAILIFSLLALIADRMIRKDGPDDPLLASYHGIGETFRYSRKRWTKGKAWDHLCDKRTSKGEWVKGYNPFRSQHTETHWCWVRVKQQKTLSEARQF